MGTELTTSCLPGRRRAAELHSQPTTLISEKHSGSSKIDLQAALVL